MGVEVHPILSIADLRMGSDVDGVTALVALQVVYLLPVAALLAIFRKKKTEKIFKTRKTGRFLSTGTIRFFFLLVLSRIHDKQALA